MNITSVVTAAALGIVTASNLSAQATDSSAAPVQPGRWELTVPSGGLFPTGTQRSAIKRGNMTAIQLMYVARRSLAITSTFGWARSRDIGTADAPKLDVFTYDVGAELRGHKLLADKAVTFTPFAGAGAGGRSYNYRKLDVDATHNLAAYASAGAELGIRRLQVRLEARDYVSGFKPLAGVGSTRTGNDIVVMAGLRIASR